MGPISLSVVTHQCDDGSTMTAVVGRFDLKRNKRLARAMKRRNQLEGGAFGIAVAGVESTGLFWFLVETDGDLSITIEDSEHVFDFDDADTTRLLGECNKMIQDYLLNEGILEDCRLKQIAQR